MMPLSILGTSFAQVYYQRLTEITTQKGLLRSYLVNLSVLLGIAAAMVVFVHLLPDNTMGFLFGDEWSFTIDYLRVLIYWFAMNFAVSGLSFVNHRIRQQKAIFALDAFHFLIVVVALAWAHQQGFEELDSVKVLVVTKVIYYLVHIVVTLLLLKTYKQNSENGN